jgi:5'-nucleotidase/UDP-sugar diphosphatase
MKLSKRLQMFTRVFFILAFVSLLILPTTGFAKVYNLTILHTNDHHGHFLKFSPFPVQDVGGLAAQSTLVNVVRAEVKEAGGYVLVLSAGDVNTGIPESDLLDAEPDFNLMNIIGYDAMTLGNHEFDNSRDVLLKQKEWAKFPFLSANIVKKDTGEPLVSPYIIKDIEGLKVAIFGLTTEETPILTLPDNTKDLAFKSAIDVARELVPKLRTEADVVIALTHLGFYEDAGGGYNSPGDLKLAKDVPGIDVIVGGHTHTKVMEPKVINNTLIVQAGAYSENVGRLNLTFDSDAKKITGSTYKLMSVNGKTRVKYNDKYYTMYVDKGYIEDQDIVEAIKPYIGQADTLLSQPVGEAAVELVGGKTESRSQETNLGNLITDGMRAKTGADIALLNGGGIRAGIAPGKITYRDVLTVQPFGNTLVLLDLTGAQVMDVLNYAATIEPGNGAFLHVSGLKWTNNKGKVENVLAGDAPIDVQKTYKVVTNNFMSAGGDGYKMLKDLPQIDSGFVDADALKEYVAKQGKVEPKVEGRLTVIK